MPVGNGGDSQVGRAQMLAQPTWLLSFRRYESILAKEQQ